jgi:hypothetical protein
VCISLIFLLVITAVLSSEDVCLMSKVRNLMLHRGLLLEPGCIVSDPCYVSLLCSIRRLAHKNQTHFHTIWGNFTISTHEC